MQSRLSRPVARLILAGLLCWSPAAWAASDNVSTVPPIDPGAMAMDLALARPGGLVATVAGAAIFVVALPFSALGGNVDEAFDSLVASPAAFTFRRPLGDFESKRPYVDRNE